jgi:6-phosphogluconolactonase
MGGNGGTSGDGGGMTAKRLDEHSLILDDAQEVADRAAAWLLECLDLNRAGTRAVCLSGGQTPQLLYATLARPPYRDAMPWSRIHWFWADERFVPPTDARSNYGMVKRLLFDAVQIPRENAHRIPTTDATPAAAADAYEQELMRHYGSRDLDSHRPLFDVTLLGVGDDGHTASLFPGSPLLHERSRWVAPVPATGVREERVTLTYPALESSRHLAFIVTGPTKRGIVEAIWNDDIELPAARVKPCGDTVWFLDRKAAPASAS